MSKAAAALPDGKGGKRKRRRNPEKMMTVIEHISELRNGILVSVFSFAAASVAGFIFSDRIVELFTRQFAEVQSVIQKQMVVSTIVEGFVTQLRLALTTGFILSSPIHVFNLLKFIFPGLSRKRRWIILAFLFASLALIVSGSYFAYFKVVPLAIAFLTNPVFVPEGVGLLLNYQANIFYVLSFILWSLVALQLPVVLEILLVFNVLSRKSVFRASRFVIVGIFVIAAIVTPPDFISQLGIALPLIVLYFLAILIAKIFKFGEK